VGDQEMEDRDAKASGHLSGAATPQQTEEKKEEQRSGKDSAVKASAEGATTTPGAAIKTEEEAKKTTSGASPGSKAAAVKAEVADVEMKADEKKPPEVKNEAASDPAANSSTIKEDEQ